MLKTPAAPSRAPAGRAPISTTIPRTWIFGSAYSSARGHAGMCRKLDRFLDPVLADRCPSYQAVDQAGTLLQRKNGERVRP
jgi:hypothetical protein